MIRKNNKNINIETILIKAALNHFDNTFSKFATDSILKRFTRVCKV